MEKQKEATGGWVEHGRFGGQQNGMSLVCCRIAGGQQNDITLLQGRGPRGWHKGSMGVS